MNDFAPEFVPTDHYNFTISEVSLLRTPQFNTSLAVTGID